MMSMDTREVTAREQRMADQATEASVRFAIMHGIACFRAAVQGAPTAPVAVGIGSGMSLPVRMVTTYGTFGTKVDVPWFDPHPSHLLSPQVRQQVTARLTSEGAQR